MARYERFTFLIDHNERRMIGALARKLERTQSDAIRVTLRKAALEAGAWVDDPQMADYRGRSGAELRPAEQLTR